MVDVFFHLFEPRLLTSQYGKHLHTAAKQLVQIFPELRVAPLYVAGESYAGKYVPALGVQIHRHKDAPGSHFNFKVN